MNSNEASKRNISRAPAKNERQFVASVCNSLYSIDAGALGPELITNLFIMSTSKLCDWNGPSTQMVLWGGGGEFDRCKKVLFWIL